MTPAGHRVGMSDVPESQEHDQDAEAPLSTPPERVEDAEDGAATGDGDQDAGPSQVVPGREGPTGTDPA